MEEEEKTGNRRGYGTFRGNGRRDDLSPASPCRYSIIYLESQSKKQVYKKSKQIIQMYLIIAVRLSHTLINFMTYWLKLSCLSLQSWNLEAFLLLKHVAYLKLCILSAICFMCFQNIYEWEQKNYLHTESRHGL